MTEADILSLRVQATRVEQVRSQMKSLQGDLMRMRQSQTSFASASRSNARAVSQSYDQMAQAARRSAAAQKQAMQGVGDSIKRSVLTAATAYGMVRLGQNALRAQQDQRQIGSAYKFNLGAVQGAKTRNDVAALAQRQGLNINDTQRTGVGLAGAGVKPEDIAATMKGLMAAGAAGGASPEGMKGAMEQYKQIAMNGKLQGDELRLIQENGVNLIKILRDAGLGERIRDKTNPLTFEEVNAAILAFGKTKEAQELLKVQADSTSASFMRAQNVLEQRIYPALAEGFGPAAQKVAEILAGWAESIDPKMIENLVLPVVGGLIVAYTATKVAQVALAWSAWRAAGALNAVAASGGLGGIGGVAGGGKGLIGKVGGLASRAWGFAGNAGTGATGVGAIGGSGIAGALSASSASGVGAALGGGAATGVAATVVSAAAVAVGAYFATKYGLDALAKAAGHDGYNDALRKDFARANGARIDSAGNESYRGSSESAFYASRARSMAKRGGAQSGDIYAKYAGLDSRNYDAALSRANSQRPANRASTQNRVARETRDAIRGAT